jgi:hypothetical protein
MECKNRVLAELFLIIAHIFQGLKSDLYDTIVENGTITKFVFVFKMHGQFKGIRVLGKGQ